MQKSIRRLALAMVAPLVLFSTSWLAAGQTPKDPYPAMAPLDQYLIPDQQSEIALARSAAPSTVSDTAEVMVLGKEGYTSAAKGGNGFVCIVERSWANSTDDPQFWNPKVRAPNCFNAPAAKSFLSIYLMKTKLVLAGKSRKAIAEATASALDTHQLPAIEAGSMCYMLSKQQYLSDDDKTWRPHVMIFAPRDQAKTWGANLHGSPIYAADDPEERVAIFMIPVPKWSDSTSPQP